MALRTVLLDRIAILGMDAIENDVERRLDRSGIEAEDAIAFLAEEDFFGGDAARPTAGVAQALAFGKIGLAAAEGIFGALALGDVTIDAVNLRGFAVDRNGGGDQRNVHQGAILAPADQFGVDALAAP